MSHYTMLSKYGNFTRLIKIKNKLKIWCFLQSREKFSIFVGVFNETIIPLVFDGYEMTVANSALVGYLPSLIQRALVE